MADGSPLGQFGQLVLTAILSQDDDAYGVTIHRCVEDLIRPRRCQLGAIYVTLDRMEDKGLVESWLSEPTAQRGGRAKRQYRLTAAGEEALREAAVTARRLYSIIEQTWGEGTWSQA